MVIGEKLTSFPLVSGFLTQSPQPFSVTKNGPRQVGPDRPVDSGADSGVAGGATWSLLTLDPLLFSWVPITQSLEATPEPSRALLEEGLVHRQCHLGSKVERPGCLQSPLPRLNPDPQMEARGYPLPARVLRMCLLCSQTLQIGTFQVGTLQGAKSKASFRQVYSHPCPVA